MKNIDGIKKSVFKFSSPIVKSKILILRSRPKKKAKAAAAKTFLVVESRPKITENNGALFFNRLYREKSISLAVAVLGIILAFGGGAWSVLNTRNSAADSHPQPLAISTSNPVTLQPSALGAPVPGNQLQAQGGSTATDELFSTPIEDLESYLNPNPGPGLIDKRTSAIQQLLKDHGSPLVGSAQTIAEQGHWQLILAITFAESTLGKNCVDNNCSNIGVKPGAPSWRSYSDYNRWVIDFNNLLDKKYSDWTLDQMCGVYVQPCNPNWLAATKQILNEIQTDNIQ